MKLMAQSARHAASAASRARVRRCLALVAASFAALLILAHPRAVLAQSAAESVPPILCEVQPGDSLAAIAARYGVPLVDLLHSNSIRHPRAIYPGQLLEIVLPQPATAAWARVALSWPADAASLARRSVIPWRSIALRNRLLTPAALLPGASLLLPPLRASAVVTPALAAAPRIATAAACGAPLWELLRLNPSPLPATGLVLVPEDCPLASMQPSLRLTLSPQPAQRGKTVALTLEASEPGACWFTFAGTTEPCHAVEVQRYVGFIGLSPLLEPGRYTVDVRWVTDAGEQLWSLPLQVAGGVYDYERIELPPSRQSLLDPSLSQSERAKIAELRLLRSPERLWELPFRWPLEAAVTSYYGSRRSYGYGFTSYHAGSDFDGETGAPVLAPASGTVVLAEPLVVRGNAILIDHGWGIISGFWHLSRIDVVPGQSVQQGQVVGALGNTGLSTGPHLHWELWVNGVDVDPLSWVFAPPLDLAGVP